MVESAESRRQRRREVLGAQFRPGDLEAALDVMALVDLAWHDCYGEAAPPRAVEDDILTLAAGDVSALARAGLLAVVGFRDARVAADERRSSSD